MTHDEANMNTFKALAAALGLDPVSVALDIVRDSILAELESRKSRKPHRFVDADFHEFLDRMTADRGYRFSNKYFDDFDFLLNELLEPAVPVEGGSYLSNEEESLKRDNKPTHAQRDFIQGCKDCHNVRAGTYEETRSGIIYALAEDCPGLLSDFISWRLRGQIDGINPWPVEATTKRMEEKRGG